MIDTIFLMRTAQMTNDSMSALSSLPTLELGHAGLSRDYVSELCKQRSVASLFQSNIR